MNIKQKYEEYHSVEYSTDAINACVKLSGRYITDRFFPDKAIDVLDEVGARVHLKNIHVPKNIVELEKQVEDIKAEKNQVVKSQKYEEAARLRDKEKHLVKSDSEYTSAIQNIFQLEGCFIVLTENSLYVVSKEIPVRKIVSELKGE
jgi:ATP-dependent Clp protease ATP-binding subunit ClpA